MDHDLKQDWISAFKWSMLIRAVERSRQPNVSWLVASPLLGISNYFILPSVMWTAVCNTSLMWLYTCFAGIWRGLQEGVPCCHSLVSDCCQSANCQVRARLSLQAVQDTSQVHTCVFLTLQGSAWKKIWARDDIRIQKHYVSFSAKKRYRCWLPSSQRINLDATTKFGLSLSVCKL